MHLPNINDITVTYFVEFICNIYCLNMFLWPNFAEKDNAVEI